MLRFLFIIIGSLAFTAGIYAQQTVTGKVTTADGEQIPGVNIMLRGTNLGTITDLDGNYSIQVPKGGGELEFRMVGMTTVYKFVESGIVNVVMEDDSKNLEEIVVVGYGTQTRSRMTTSISKLNSKTLESMPRANAASALQGTIAGLQVSHNTGQPGATPTMVLRGGTSWDGTGELLVLIDGVESSFYALNPEDIESVEVLKDAASTAIYGARSANGVVLITTKKGKAGQSSINYTYKFGINKRRKGYDYLNAHDYIYYNRLAVKNYTEVTGRNNFDKGFLNGISGGFGTGNNTTNSPFTTQILTDANRYLLSQPGWYQMPDPINPSQTLIYMDNQMNELFYQNSTVNDHYL
ncbi:MAG: SusC/RagA family TonB-linked outer membrane protein, partial [Draconibacterium sp.]